MHANTLTLHDLTASTGIEVLDYLDRTISIPITAEPQAQGDLIVIPADLLKREVTIPVPPPGVYIFAGGWFPVTVDVELTGIEVLRSSAGGNPHTLVADSGTCTWTTGVRDVRQLALGIVETTGVAYLIHPEHGATGIAPGRYVIRRQRELGLIGSGAARLGPGLGPGDRGIVFVAD